MKRKNLILTNTLLLMLSSILFLVLLHTVEIKHYESTIGSTFFQTVADNLTGTAQSIRRNKLWERPWEADQLAMPRDVSAIYVGEEKTLELNSSLSSTDLSYYLQTDFLSSKQWEELSKSGEDVLQPIRITGKAAPFRKLYVMVDFIEDSEDVLLLAKNTSVWDNYLRNNEVFFFFLILVFLGNVFYFYFLQQRKVYNPVLAITEAAYQYTEKEFDSRVMIKSNDEIGNLATSVMKLGKAFEASTIMNKKEKNLLEHVFDSLSVGVLSVDEDYQVTSLNTAGEKYYASHIRSADQSMKKGMNKKYAAVIRECFETGTGQRMEVQQSQLIFDVRFSPVFSEEENKMTGVLLLIEEITNAKRLAAIREELITNVSHDFRTPLATIKGYSEAIIDNIAETADEKNEMAQIIHDEATQLNEMITKLLDFSRMKAGYSELEIEEVNIAAFFKRVLNRFADTLTREKIVCTLTVEEGLQTIQADEDRLHHAIYNLIDNAIRYAADPEERTERYIRIEVKLDSLLDQILIIVSDNGIGISEEGLPFIFERFYKDDKARTRPKTNGSGIGLSLVYSILKKHGGGIEVESEQDEGTTFTMRLPYQETVYADRSEE